MAKRSSRSHVRHAKDRLVCVWGLISILDFRHFRSPRKMLTYKRERSRQSFGTGRLANEIEESTRFNENLRGARVNQEGTASVRTLIEKEMGKEPKESDSRQDSRRKKNGKKSKTRSDRRSQQNTEQVLENFLSEKNIVEEFCPQIYPHHFEERLRSAVKEVLSQQLICGKHKELVNVLQNLQHSHSIREISNSLSESDLPGDGEYKQVNFLGKEAEFRETMPSDESGHTQAPNTIVILKPELISSETTQVHKAVGKGHSARLISRSFLSSIKRRLITAISLSKNRLHIEKASQDKSVEKSCKMADNSELRVAKIYIEAKKYLSEMLSNDDEGSDILTAEFSDKLGRILSLPEFICSSIGSPRRDTSLIVTKRSSPVVEFPREIGNNADSNPVVPIEQIIETKLSVYQTVAEETAFAPVDNTNFEEYAGDSEEFSPENFSSGHSCEASNDNECDQHVIKNFDDEDAVVLSPLFSPPGALFVEKAKHLEIGIDKTEQPSPVSVLEPLFTEDDCSPTRTKSRSRGHPIQLLQIEFDDRDDSTAGDINTETLDKRSIINSVEAVLHTLKLNWTELYLKSLSSDQLLELSSLRDVDIKGAFRFHDKKLLLDCINEVLLEFNHHSVLPGFCFLSKINGIHKVCERVYWHLLPPPLPRTLEQIVGKDLMGKETWMDMHLEVESLGIDMGEIILEELIQDTFTSCVDRTSESERLPIVCAEQIVN